MTYGCRSSKGFILISVLMASTLFLGAAASFALFAKTQMRKVSDREFALQARTLAVVACNDVSDWIAGDTNAFDSAREKLYTGVPLVLRFDDWKVIINIMPQDALIPINAIFLPDGVTIKKEYEYAWEKIWEILDKEDIAPIVLDFLDKDSEPRTGGREETGNANGMISDLSELLILPEVNAALLYGNKNGDPSLSDFFTVYGGEKINFNLVPRHVLSILDPDIWGAVLDSMMDYRSKNNAAKADDIAGMTSFPKTAAVRLNNVIAFKSDYFLVRMSVGHLGREHNFAIMMKRAPKCQIIYWRE
ncbi:hypothetical protein FACS1894167_03700 [Synergistales bacterium]|nr:hypothetical protein FACS1894167_03700 [Synergistales bacterium]